MALESTTCGIVHHARQTRAHCPTMVSSFKLSSGTVCLLGFSCRAGHTRKQAETMVGQVGQKKEFVYTLKLFK